MYHGINFILFQRNWRSKCDSTVAPPSLTPHTHPTTPKKKPKSLVVIEQGLMVMDHDLDQYSHLSCTGAVPKTL